MGINVKLCLVKSLILSVFLGAIICIVGMAIAIPPCYYKFFDKLDLSLLLFALFNQFLSFALLALFSGYLLGKVAKRDWLLNVFLCYLTFLSIMFYCYSVSLSDLFGLGAFYNTPNLLIPMVLLVPAYFGQKVHKFNEKNV